jgi:C-terminal processing protease CtpA/Prc
MRKLLGTLALLGTAGVAMIVLGCSGGGESPQARLDSMEKENKLLHDQVDKQSGDLRQLRKDLDDARILVDQHDKSLPKIEEDLRSRIKEMVAQEGGGGGRRWRPEAPAPQIEPKFEVKPYMGFDAQDLLPDVAEALKLKVKTGVLVTDVQPGSPAAVAGMAKNDILLTFDGQEIKEFKDLRQAFAGKKPGDAVAITVLRGEEKMKFDIKLGAKKVRVG